MSSSLRLVLLSLEVKVALAQRHEGRMGSAAVNLRH